MISTRLVLTWVSIFTNGNGVTEPNYKYLLESVAGPNTRSAIDLNIPEAQVRPAYRKAQVREP